MHVFSIPETSIVSLDCLLWWGLLLVHRNYTHDERTSSTHQLQWPAGLWTHPWTSVCSQDASEVGPSDRRLFGEYSEPVYGLAAHIIADPVLWDWVFRADTQTLQTKLSIYLLKQVYFVLPFILTLQLFSTFEFSKHFVNHAYHSSKSINHKPYLDRSKIKTTWLFHFYVLLKPQEE